jgi:hypothetical protein
MATASIAERPREATIGALRTVAKVLGSILLAVGALWAVVLAGVWYQGDRTAMLGAAVLAVAFALPGWLFLSWAAVAERRYQAGVTVQKRDRFTIDEVASLLKSSPEMAHAFIADQIARHGLQLVYQPDTRGYARRALSAPPPPPPPPPPAAPAAPCPSCGVQVAPSEAGFCPNCGARRA